MRGIRTRHKRTAAHPFLFSAVATLAIIAAVLLVGFGLSGWLERLEISSFEECAAAGYPVMESYPRQCAAAGRTFVEQIESKGCVADEECVVFGESGDCNCGCYNRNDLPGSAGGECFCAAPVSCRCVGGACEGVFS